MALVTCPTNSIGSSSKQDVQGGVASFPEALAEGVSYCGFASPDSFGASSYFVENPAGNVLVDSPALRAPCSIASRHAGESAACSSRIATTSRIMPC